MTDYNWHSIGFQDRSKYIEEKSLTSRFYILNDVYKGECTKFKRLNSGSEEGFDHSKYTIPMIECADKIIEMLESRLRFCYKELKQNEMLDWRKYEEVELNIKQNLSHWYCTRAATKLRTDLLQGTNLDFKKDLILSIRYDPDNERAHRLWACSGEDLPPEAYKPLL